MIESVKTFDVIKRVVREAAELGLTVEVDENGGRPCLRLQFVDTGNQLPEIFFNERDIKYYLSGIRFAQLRDWPPNKRRAEMLSQQAAGLMARGGM